MLQEKYLTWPKLYKRHPSKKFKAEEASRTKWRHLPTLTWLENIGWTLSKLLFLTVSPGEIWVWLSIGSHRNPLSTYSCNKFKYPLVAFPMVSYYFLLIISAWFRTELSNVWERKRETQHLMPLYLALGVLNKSRSTWSSGSNHIIAHIDQ